MTACACFGGIVALHAFFAAWYRGEDSDLSVLEAALGESFRIITPKANILDRAGTIAGVAAGRGTDPTASIDVVDRGCSRAGGLHLATYEEHQRFADGSTVRLSSVVLSETEAGWTWHLVHETWMGAEAV